MDDQIMHMADNSIDAAQDDVYKLRKYLAELAQNSSYNFSSQAKASFRYNLTTFTGLSPYDISIDPDYHNHYHRPCGRKFQKGEACYRCLTCGFDETCALCSYCFQLKKHIGHQVHKGIIQRDANGCCDCGDPEAYLGLECEYYDAPIEQDKLLSEAKLEKLSSTVSTLLDFVLDVTAHSFTSLIAPETQSSVIRWSKMAALQIGESVEDNDTPCRKYALVLYNDQTHQFRDAVQRVRFATGKVLEFAEMVVSKCNTYGKSIVMVSTDIPFLLSKQEILESTGLTSCIRNLREVFREDMSDEIVTWVNDLTNSNVMKNNQSLRDALSLILLRKHKLGFQYDPMPTCNFVNPDEDLKYEQILDELHVALPKFRRLPYRPLKDGMSSKWEIPSDIMDECGYTDLHDPRNGLIHFEGSRFQYLAFYDIRFCKSTRIKLHDIFVSTLVNSLRYKMMMTAQYVDIYIELASMFLSIDREPEFSLLPVLSPQLFTCPPNCTAIVRHGDLCKLMYSIGQYLRTGSPYNSELPLATRSNGILYNSLKNRKWGHIFLDMTYILSRNQAVDHFFSSEAFFKEALNVLGLFQGKPTIVREVNSHIEYEATDYGLYFNGMSVISHFSENIGKAVNKGHNAEVYDELIRSIINTLVVHVFSEFPISTDSSETGSKKIVEDQEDPVLFHDVTMNQVTCRVVNFEVLSNKLSLLHPLHSLLSWFVEMNVSWDSSEKVADLILIMNSIAVLDAEGCPRPKILAGDVLKGIFDIPLRTLVFLSQIKVGLWVRNGLSLRNQMNIYRNSGIRDFGYMRDVFMVQLFCALESTDVTLITFIERWGLNKWCQKEFKEGGYPINHIQEIVEEFFLFLINILTEDMHLHKRSASEILDLRIEREIVQTLCLKPSSYSDITTEISEHITSEKRFFAVFSQCVEEVPATPIPSGQSSGYKEIKIYNLKEELFDSVDPYYIHYSSNKRDDCAKVVKERLQKKKKISLENIYLPPKSINWENSPFKYIIQITCSIHFISIIESTMEYCSPDFAEQEESGLDLLLDLVLHLIHVAIKQMNADVFIEKFLTKSKVPSIMLAMLSNDKYNNFYPKIRAILTILCQFYKFDIQVLSTIIKNYDENLIVPHADNGDESAFEKKKRLAKKKKNKILANFKKQQQKFAESLAAEPDLMDLDDDDDENIDGSSWQFPQEHCILCQMPAITEDEPFGVISYITQSNEFRSIPFEDKYWFYKSFSGNPNLDELETKTFNKVDKYLDRVEHDSIIGPGFPGSAYACNENHSVFTSCGHGMHLGCYVNFLKAAKNRQLAQITKTIPEDTQRQEFLCPLCKAVNNVFIPIFYSSNRESLQGKLKNTSITILDPGLDKVLSSVDKRSLEAIRGELISSVKSKVKPQYWFIKEDDHHIETETKPFQALNHSLSVLARLSLPFDGISAIITKTIESIEVSLRGSMYEFGTLPLVIYQLSNQTLTALRIWSQLRELIRCTETTSSTSEKYNKGFLTYPERLIGLLNNICHDDDLLFEGEDYFKLLVGAEEVQSIGLDFSKLVHTCYLKHLKQSLLIIMAHLQSRNFDTIDCSVEHLSQLDYQSTKLDQIWEQFSAGMTTGGTQYGKTLYLLLVKLVTPFLRKCMIYSYVRFSNVSLTSLPELWDYNLECDKLCAVLNLPTINEYLEAVPTAEFSGVSDANRIKLCDAKVLYPGKIKLITLPLKMNRLFGEYYNLLPSKPVDPAICLFCSTLVDMQTSNYGDRIGSCNAHCTWECITGGFGIFLIMKSNSILLLNKGRGSFFESPYIDDHGEVDEDAKKGHDLHLSVAKYDEFIKTVWLQHNIPNQIARKLENQPDIGGWTTL